MTDRMKYSLRNIGSSFAAQIFSNILGFVARTVFIYTLGRTYLGMDGVFGDVLQLLSLTDLGLGTALKLSFYRPLAEHNELEIAGIMRTYRKVSIATGFAYFFVGLCFIPFLDFFVTADNGVKNLVWIYVLYLLRSFVGCFFVYKQALIQADQKGYIVTLFDMAFSLIKNVVLIAVLLLTRAFTAYMLAQIALIPLENYLLARKADRLYPYLRQKKAAPLTREVRSELVRKVRAMVFHNLGSAVSTGTDNLLITKFIGLQETACYTAYYGIRALLSTFFNTLMGGFAAGIGNMVTREEMSFSKDTFDRLEFVSFTIRSFFCVCMINMFQPFVRVWIGSQYLLSAPVMVLLVSVFYADGTLSVVYNYRNALGLFYNDRYKSLIEAFLNLGLSLLLLPKLGTAGVVLGTLLANLFCSIPLEPYILYKRYFHRPVWEYHRMQLGYLCYTAAATAAVYLICLPLQGDSVLWLLLRTAGVGCSALILYLICFGRTKHFHFFWGLLEGMLPESVRKHLPGMGGSAGTAGKD